MTGRMRCEYFLVIVLTASMGRLPIARRHALARLLGLVWYYLIPFRKKVVLSNIKAAFGGQNQCWYRQIARRNLQQICRWYLDLAPFYLYDDAQFERRVRVANEEILRQAIALNKGCLIVTYHFGNWEILADWLARRGFWAGAVAKRQKNRLIDQWLTNLRQRHGLRLFFKSRRNAWELKRFLNQGGTLLLVADQDARKNGIFVDFLGRPAATHRGPALFALQGQVPIVLSYCMWNGQNYQINFLPVAYTASAATFEQNVLALTQQIATQFEALIRQFPEHYYWVHRRWKTQPSSV